MKTFSWLWLLLELPVSAGRADEVQMPRTYFIGNSLTDHFTADRRDYNPNGPAIDRICKVAGLPKWPNAGKNIAGAPLWWHWYHDQLPQKALHSIRERKPTNRSET